MDLALAICNNYRHFQTTKKYLHDIREVRQSFKTFKLPDPTVLTILVASVDRSIKGMRSWEYHAWALLIVRKYSVKDIRTWPFDHGWSVPASLLVFMMRFKTTPGISGGKTKRNSRSGRGGGSAAWDINENILWDYLTVILIFKLMKWDQPSWITVRARLHL